MNTKNDGLVKGDSFKIRQFLVFMLIFWGYTSQVDLPKDDDDIRQAGEFQVAAP